MFTISTLQNMRVIFSPKQSKKIILKSEGSSIEVISCSDAPQNQGATGHPQA